MNIDRSKSMGFRNSGKFSFAGRGKDLAILAGLVFAVALVLLLLGGKACSGSGPVGAPDKFFVKCTECDKEWEIKPDERSNYQDRERRDEQGHQIGGDCPHCKKEGCVYVMFPCPKCGKHYLSKEFTEPEKFEAGEVRDICPYCDTDLKKWYAENRKKR